MTYRPDIDGFRAIAVLAVVLFHCDFTLFSGGYVGVDVFFTISGFLITRLILGELRAGPFDWRGFYVRRIRRLLPALAATVAVTMAIALVLFSPHDLESLGQTSVFVLFSLSNFHYAAALDYFASSAKLDPVLHTWSLAVEEQFYLVWPVVLLLAYRFRGMVAVGALIVVGTLASLALSEYWIDVNPRHAYYLPPFRAFQFTLGAAAGIWLAGHRLPRLLEQAALALGLGLVIGTAILFTPETPFPGFAGLVPSVGAVLVLWAGRAAGLGRVLDNPVSIWLGSISYSIYLVHWPIAVFWRYLSPEPFGLAEQGALFVLAILFGQILYSAVERPFRLHRGDPRVNRWGTAGRVGAALAALAAIGGGLWAAAGVPARMTFAPEAEATARASEFHFLADYGNGVLTEGRGETGMRVLIFGDSMMQNYIPALLDIDRIGAGRVDIVSRGGCVLAATAELVNAGSVDSSCQRLRARLYALEGPWDLVIWGQNWLEYRKNLRWRTADGLVRAFPAADAMTGWQPGLAATLDHFAGRAGRIAIIGPQVVAKGVNPVLTRIGPLTTPEMTRPDRLGMAETRGPERDALTAAFVRFLADRPTVTLIDPRALVCPDGPCRFHADGRSYYMDPLHHTRAATGFLAGALASQLP